MENQFKQNGVGSRGSKPEMELKDFVYKYIIGYWYLFAAGLFLGLSCAYLYMRYSTAIYKVQSKILVKDEERGSAAEDMVFQDLGVYRPSRNVTNEIEILKSRTLMHEVAKNLQLHVTHHVEGDVKTSETFNNKSFVIDSLEIAYLGYGQRLYLKEVDNRTFEYKLGGQATIGKYGDWIEIQNLLGFRMKRGLHSTRDDYGYFMQFHRPEDVVNRYTSTMKVNVAHEWSSVLNLSLEDPVPDKASAILDKLVEVYNNASIEDKGQVAKNTLDFIDERLDYLQSDLSGVEADLESFKNKNKISTTVEADVELLIQEGLEYDKALSELNIQQSMLDALEEYFEDNDNHYKLVPRIGEIGTEELSAHISNYNQLILNRDRLLQDAHSDNPEVLLAEAGIDKLKNTLLETIRATQREMKQKLSVAADKYAGILGRISSIPRKERQLLEIKRQQAIKENLFLYLLQKREETALTLAVATPNARQIDPAVNLGKQSPQSLMAYALGFIGGLAFPALLLFLVDLFDTRIRTEEEIRQRLDTPILGSIAYSKSSKPLAVHANSRTAVAEMFRLVRTNLNFAAAGKQKQTILITSAYSAEGKTFVTVNLGVSLAISGKRILMLGMDMRKPKLHEYIGASSNDLGLSNYLIGQNSIGEVTMHSQLHENLDFICSGPIPPNPAELILHERMSALFEYAQEHYDYILIDTPPVGLVADSLLLNRHIDRSIFIIRYGATKKDVLDLVEDVSQKDKLKNLSIIFNGVKSKAGYGYGRRYGYGYGYYEESKKQ